MLSEKIWEFRSNPKRFLEKVGHEEYRKLLVQKPYGQRS
jgi:hypothetical protein